MPIQLIHVSDIHLGSGEKHGTTNPLTGLNCRLEDFVAALSKTVDYAIDIKADLFLFSGDAYKNACPEPIYQKLFARQLLRLSRASIPCVLLVGNHDQLFQSHASHAMSVFQSLEVPGVTVIDRPQLLTLTTPNGALQLIGLPHVTRHHLMTSETYTNASAQQIENALVNNVSLILNDYYNQLDPQIPTVVTAHMTVDRAIAGIEKELLVGYTLTFPTDIFIHPHVDYVALGHVHKHQIIRDNHPTILYAGSLERVDFGEQAEDKGFIHVQVERNHVNFKFVSITPRPFLTLEIDLCHSANPMDDLLNSIKNASLQDAVVRIRYRIKEDQLHLIDEAVATQHTSTTLSCRFQPEIVSTTLKARLPELTESSAAQPLQALATYLEATAPERKDKLLNMAQELIELCKQTPDS